MLKDMTGQSFGRLRVIEQAESIVSGDQVKARWLCVCECGGTKITRAESLRLGRTRSCGCLQRENGGYKPR